MSDAVVTAKIVRKGWNKGKLDSTQSPWSRSTPMKTALGLREVEKRRAQKGLGMNIRAV
jgi:hypothetical protein